MPTHTATDRQKLVANLSVLFTEYPLLERPAAARLAGFSAVEAWWSFPTAEGGPGLEALVGAIEQNDLALTGLNFFAGDMAAGERGLVSRSDRRDEFVANVGAIVEIARRTGASGFNALYGQRQPDLDPGAQDQLALENLIYATQELAPVGGTVLIEPLTRGANGAYPIETAEQAIAIVDRVRDATGTTNVALLFDTYHLSSNGEDLLRVIDKYVDKIGHVQLADAPGRGAPGTGTVPFAEVLDALADKGYRGLIAAEYLPDGPTAETLGWLSEI